MNKEQQNIDLIEGYLNQTLNEEEIRLFHEKRIMDEDFETLFQDMEWMIEGIKRSASKSSLEDKLQRVQQSMDNSDEEDEEESETVAAPSKGLRRLYPFKKYSYAVAASLALMVLAAIALLNINRLPTNNEKLFAQNFQPFDNSSPTTRGGDSANGDELLRNALSYYNGEQYEQAYELFHNYNTQNPDQPLYLMYEGNALMKLGRFDAAVQQFERILDLDTGLNVYANWYVGLCLVKQGDLESAREYLEVVANSKSSESIKAQKILDKL